MEQQIDLECTDLLGRLASTIRSRLEMLVKYPFVLEFFDKYSQEISPTNFKEFREKTELSVMKKMYTDDLDLTMLKNGLDVGMTVSVARYLISGIINKSVKSSRTTNKHLNVEKVMLEINEYFDFLKIHFYK